MSAVKRQKTGEEAEVKLFDEHPIQVGGAIDAAAVVCVPASDASDASAASGSLPQPPVLIDDAASTRSVASSSPGPLLTAPQSSRKHRIDAAAAASASAVISSPAALHSRIFERTASPVSSISPTAAATASSITAGVRTPRTPTHSARVPRLHIDTTDGLCRPASAEPAEQKELTSASYEHTPLYLPSSPLAPLRRVVPLPNLPYSLLSTPNIALSPHEFVRSPVRFSNGTRAVVTTRTPFDPDNPDVEKSEHKPKAVVITFPGIGGSGPDSISWQLDLARGEGWPQKKLPMTIAYCCPDAGRTAGPCGVYIGLSQLLPLSDIATVKVVYTQVGSASHGVADVRAAIDWCVQRRWAPLILVGWSMGSAVIVEAAAHYRDTHVTRDEGTASERTVPVIRGIVTLAGDAAGVEGLSSFHPDRTAFLFVHGSQDSCVPPSCVAAMRRLVPAKSDVTVVELPNDNHGLPSVMPVLTEWILRIVGGDDDEKAQIVSPAAAPSSVKSDGSAVTAASVSTSVAPVADGS